MEESGFAEKSKRQFVLDIGTRSVVGIAGQFDGEVFAVEAWACENHPRRAMIDGQIEDIEQVARLAKTVTQRIEKALNTTFKSVSVAAAGRALKTARASAQQNFAGQQITAQMAYGLESAAVNSARLLLDNTDDMPYYCVGHTALRFMLDGYPFANALGHRATNAEVEVIATFLPAGVVESLHSCMDLLQLEIETLTLEPIAAMRAVIPKDLRLLNLALADIGAGTSDIAIAKDSTVAGYTMATVAGDEITESIIRQCLVDFNTAEELKIALSSGGPFVFKDILGFEQTLQEQDLLESIQPAVDNLAQVIAKKITDANGNIPPSAVFLVGGGSKTPGLCGKVADALGLAHNKVALAGTNFSGKIVNKNSGLDSPEYATPIGIALIAADNAQVQTASVTVNGEKVKLFVAKASNVMDALLIAGYRYTDLMGRSGKPLIFSLNGVRTTLRGTPYTTAQISLNGKDASLTTQVQNGDVIDIVKAQNGQDARAIIKDYSKGQNSIEVVLNGTALLAGLVCRINGAVANHNNIIAENDDVVLEEINTLQELCSAAKIPTDGASIMINGVAANTLHVLQSKDIILLAAQDGSTPAPVVQNPSHIQQQHSAPVLPFENSPKTQSPKPETENVLPQRDRKSVV